MIMITTGSQEDLTAAIALLGAVLFPVVPIAIEEMIRRLKPDFLVTINAMMVTLFKLCYAFVSLLAILYLNENKKKRSYEVVMILAALYSYLILINLALPRFRHKDDKKQRESIMRRKYAKGAKIRNRMMKEKYKKSNVIREEDVEWTTNNGTTLLIDRDLAAGSHLLINTLGRKRVDTGGFVPPSKTPKSTDHFVVQGRLSSSKDAGTADAEEINKDYDNEDAERDLGDISEGERDGEGLGQPLLDGEPDGLDLNHLEFRQHRGNTLNSDEGLKITPFVGEDKEEGKESRSVSHRG